MKTRIRRGAGRPGHGTAIASHNRSAARLPPGDRVDLPSAPYLHVLVTQGRLTVDGVDAPPASRRNPLVWEMHTALGAGHRQLTR